MHNRQNITPTQKPSSGSGAVWAGLVWWSGGGSNKEIFFAFFKYQVNCNRNAEFCRGTGGCYRNNMYYKNLHSIVVLILSGLLFCLACENDNKEKTSWKRGSKVLNVDSVFNEIKTIDYEKLVGLKGIWRQANMLIIEYRPKNLKYEHSERIIMKAEKDQIYFLVGIDSVQQWVQTDNIVNHYLFNRYPDLKTNSIYLFQKMKEHHINRFASFDGIDEYILVIEKYEFIHRTNINRYYRPNQYNQLDANWYVVKP